MADTQRGDFPNTPCSDCGELGTTFQHTGRLVPEGEKGNFCLFCWKQRMLIVDRKESPKPLGIKPPGVPKEFSDKTIKATTQTGSIYEFGTPNKKGERTVFCSTRDLGFAYCRILSLIVGEDLWLKSADGETSVPHFWVTTRVVSIEE
ncbi:MAG: hypothetical protein WC998_01935 [Candidatus Paceibacterota bacterium]|jgi:hypothetical protein